MHLLALELKLRPRLVLTLPDLLNTRPEQGRNAPNMQEYLVWMNIHYLQHVKQDEHAYRHMYGPGPDEICVRTDRYPGLPSDDPGDKHLTLTGSEQCPRFINIYSYKEVHILQKYCP